MKILPGIAEFCVPLPSPSKLLIYWGRGKKRFEAMNSYNFIAGRPLDREIRRMRGMTLIELLIAAFIISTLTAIGYIGYQEFYYRGQISHAVGDIGKIDAKLHLYYAENVAFPPPWRK